MLIGDYLRVLTPVTSDGVTLMYDESGQPKYREDHAPLSARKKLEEKNLLLPTHLRKKIEFVSSFVPPQISEPINTNKKVKA